MQFLSLDIYTGKYKDFLKILKNPAVLTLVFTPNPEILLAASKDELYLQTLKKANYLTPDGNGLYVGSLLQEGINILSAYSSLFFRRKSLEKRYGELIAGSDLTRDLVQYAQKENKKILLIDSAKITQPKNDFEVKKKYIQEHMSDLLAERYKNLSIQVFFLGDMTPEAIAHYIEINHIDYVFTCTGMKSQETLLTEIFLYLPLYAKIVGLGVGSSFDYLLGLQKRAPKFLQRFGLEWLYRLILNPRKRWSRIIDAIWGFPMLVANMKRNKR